MTQKLGLIRGFAQGTILVERNTGNRILLPFQDTATEASMDYTGEMAEAMTFSDQGVMGISQSCLQQEGLTFSIQTNDISWSMLQASTLTRAIEAEDPLIVAETIVLSEVDVDGDSTAILSATPVITAELLEQNGLPVSGVAVADISGTQYLVTLTGSTVTFAADFTGVAMTFYYLRAAAENEQIIQVGKGERLLKGGFYGLFFGCPGTLLVFAPRVALQPNTQFGVSSGSTASSAITLVAERVNGRFADIIRLIE